MNEELTLSTAGINLIKHFEGCREEIGPNQYRVHENPQGTKTIGWGHTEAIGRKFSAGDVWSGSECERVLLYDLTHAVDRVRRLVRVRLSQQQFDVLTSFAHNVGAEALARSDLLKKLNNKNYQGAAEEFLRWNRCEGKTHEGLSKRRERESRIFLGGQDPNYTGGAETITAMEGDMPQKVDPPTEEPPPKTETPPTPETIQPPTTEQLLPETP
jgi:lysozyme